ncbi:DUF2059 domain-containing protein [Sphingomonas lycopersici]|uniref:DUF2059 domain-containing protein n=1 Tax=Sphingomonas lycopersici TaxID=2951807 RepID=A0AA41ZIF2_9SPHN|nr:DUF2059 domain-containing protein [Sphingomonas lycopersici]MCW6537519.1 DUF2059 domain-containing protein [Sphingomonas lycopersici]
MMLRHALCAAALFAAPTPLLAEPVTEAPAALPAPDPARLVAARPVIDALWPLGTYARVMHATMDQVVQGTMMRMFDMKPHEFAKNMGLPADASKAKDVHPDETLGQAADRADPYFRERMRITMKVMGDEMATLMTEIEPGVRDALTASYARRFSVAELGDLQRFFATPTGKAYASDSMLLMMGPDMVNAMQAFVPKMMQAMPKIMAHVADATKHLPPPPKKTSTDAATGKDAK